MRRLDAKHAINTVSNPEISCEKEGKLIGKHMYPEKSSQITTIFQLDAVHLYNCFRVKHWAPFTVDLQKENILATKD